METPSSEPESKQLREKLLPQASLRFFLLLIGISAGVMVVFRLAFMQDFYWAKILALLGTMVAACFAGYAAMFLLANLFAVSTRPIRSALVGDVENAPPESEDR
ncbi:MAG: hypothetical protein AAGG48_06705 [Planctomycetota bacterium]